MRTRRGEITTCCESYAPLGTLWASARFPYHSLNVGLWTISRLGAVCAVNSHCMETYNFTSVRFLFAQLRQWDNYRLKGNDCTAQMCKAYPATDFLSHFGWLSAVFGVPSRVFVLVKKKKKIRAQELCGSRGGRPELPVPNSPHGLCVTKLERKHFMFVCLFVA